MHFLFNPTAGQWDKISHLENTEAAGDGKGLLLVDGKEFVVGWRECAAGLRECAVRCWPHPGPAHADQDLVHVQRVERRSAGAV